MMGREAAFWFGEFQGREHTHTHTHMLTQREQVAQTSPVSEKLD